MSKMTSNTEFTNFTDALEDYKVKIVGGRIIRYKVDNNASKNSKADESKSGQDLKAKKGKSDEKNTGNKSQHHKNESKSSKNGALQDNNHSLDLHLKFCPTTLPSQPITLTLEEEKELEKRLRRELAASSVQSLKNSYVSLHRSDGPVEGYRDKTKDTICSFEQLAYSLYRYKMSISLWNLRLVASIFTTGESQVDYEEVLKYISKYINNPEKSEKKIKKKTHRKASEARDEDEKVLLSYDKFKSESISSDINTRKRSLTETSRSNKYNIISNVDYVDASNNANHLNNSFPPNKNIARSGNEDGKKPTYTDDEEEEVDEDNDDDGFTDENDSDDDDDVSDDSLRSEKIGLLLKVMSKEKFASKESMLRFIEDYSTLLKLSINLERLGDAMASVNHVKGKIDGKTEAGRLRAFFEDF